MFISKLQQIWRLKQPFLQDPYNKFGFGLGLIFNLAAWAVLYFMLKPGLSNVLLNYNVVYGADLIGPGLYAYAIPSGALIILLINLSIASSFYEKEKLAAYFMSFATAAVELIFLIAAIVLAVINA